MNEFLVETVIELTNALMMQPDDAEGNEPTDVRIPHSESGATFVRAANLRLGHDSDGLAKYIEADYLEFYAGRPDEEGSAERIGERLDYWKVPLIWAYAQRAKEKLVPGFQVGQLSVYNAGKVRATFVDALLLERDRLAADAAIVFDDNGVEVVRLPANRNLGTFL